MSHSAGGRVPTMLDVARAAGVSRALVSIVMREVPGASDETRARVKAVAAELGYVLDARARALRAQAQHAIGVMFQPDQFFHSVLIDGIYAHAEAAKLPVVLSAVTAMRDEEAAIESLLVNRCGSILAIAPRMDPEALATLALRVPVVALAEVVIASGVDSVSSDDDGGVAGMVDHLVGLGHRRIWFGESPTSGGNTERRQGFQRAMAGHGLADGARVIPAGSTAEGGATAARFILEQDQPPTAVIGFNDACAAGIQDVLTRAGVRVPEDISVAGYDDAPVAAVSYRQLTTIRQDIELIGRTAVDLAVRRMTGVHDGTGVHLLPARLIVRNSTAAPSLEAGEFRVRRSEAQVSS